MSLRKLLTLILLGALPLTASAGDYSGREEVEAFISELSAREHLDPAQLRASLEGARSLPRVIDLIRPPANPGVRSWVRYRARFLDTTRIRNGVRFWAENAQPLQQAEARSGVPAEIIVAIIGVETVYGKNTGNFETLSALATLAFDYPPRAELFRRELGALFVLAAKEGRDPASYRGSYAGALGLPQFLPSSLLAFAVDGDGDGHIDLSGSRNDAIFSVGNFLAAHGWQRGQGVACRTRPAAPEALPPLLAAGLEPSLQGDSLANAGIPLCDTADGPYALIELASPEAAAQYWLAQRNFYVITRYNRSSFYAMSVYELAQAIALARRTTQ